jgi:hypothetical protein
MSPNQTLVGVKIIKLVNGEDVVTVIPAGKNQLPDNSQLVRIEKPLLIKYVPQMTMTGFKDYVALIKWCAYTSDIIVTIPKDKIMTITNATSEMASSYMNVASSYEKTPVSIRNEHYKSERLSDKQNEKLNDIFDELDDDEESTIH